MKTKDKIRSLLLENRGETISGEKLAKECSVSRAAIWKAINALREEGLGIEGTTNGGYRISGDADVVSEQTVRADLAKMCAEFGIGPAVYAQVENARIECFSEIDSTNSYAKRLLSDAGNLRRADGSLTEIGKQLSSSIYIAETQTAGRGRLGRNFYSPKQKGVYLSIIYVPEGGVKNPARLTASAAVAVKRAIKRLFNLEVQIKWINDVFYNGKKLCGILAEGITNFETGIIEAAVIGIGINISASEEDIPAELKHIVGTIQGALQSELREKSAGADAIDGSETPSLNGARSRLSALTVLEFLSVMKEMEENPSSVIQEYRDSSLLIGKKITVFPLAGEQKNSYEAEAVDIDENASLVVRLADGTQKTLSSGEVSIGSGNLTPRRNPLP